MPEVAPKEEELEKKAVTPKAMARLAVAKEAIAVTKRAITFGAGNQVDAIAASKMNSKFRMDAMREPSYWELAPELVKMARENPEALVAAKADLVHGGNCGEHGWIAFDYIRQHCAGDIIERVTSVTFTIPRSIRPVTTVPRPEIENTSSIGSRNAPSIARFSSGM